MAFVTSNELAKAAGVTRARLTQWRGEGMPGYISRNNWDSEVALAWVAERRDDGSAGIDKSDRDRLTAMRIELTRAQTRGQELRNKRLEGVSVDASAVRSAVSAVFAGCIEAGGIWVSQGRTAKEQDMRREVWHELRAILGGGVESVCADIAGGDDVAPARVQYSERMG